MVFYFLQLLKQIKVKEIGRNGHWQQPMAIKLWVLKLFKLKISLIYLNTRCYCECLLRQKYPTCVNYFFIQISYLYLFAVSSQPEYNAHDHTPHKVHQYQNLTTLTRNITDKILFLVCLHVQILHFWFYQVFSFPCRDIFFLLFFFLLTCYFGTSRFSAVWICLILNYTIMLTNFDDWGDGQNFLKRWSKGNCCFIPYRKLANIYSSPIFSAYVENRYLLQLSFHL